MQPTGSKRRAADWRSAAALAILLAAVVAFHAPGLGTGFLSDDYLIVGHVWREGLLGGWAQPFLSLTCVLFYRPLLSTSYGIDLLVWGLNPWGYHFTNLLLHLAVTLALFQVGRALTRSPVAGLVAAALIGLHPLNPNTVTWAAGRVSLLAGLFSLAAILAFLRHRRRPTRLRAAAAVGALVAGLLAKESVVVLPLFLLLADCILARLRVALGLHLVLWSVLAAYFVVRRAVLGVWIGGYGAFEGGSGWAGAGPFHVRELLGSLPRLLVPGVVELGAGVWLVWAAVLLVVALVVLWARRGAPGGRAVVVSVIWAGAMAALIYPSWELCPENAERWYPALLGIGLVLGVVCAGAGRLGLAVAAVLVVLGLPALRNRVDAYRETGARVRRLVAAAQAVPVERGPLFVFNLPLVRAGAPFLHHGLADALAPPFGTRMHGVFPVHALFTELGGALNPAALVIAREQPLAVLLCDDDGRVEAPVDRDYLLAYPGFEVFRPVPALTWRATIEHEPVGGIRLRVRASGARRLTVDVFSAAGMVRLHREVPDSGVWDEVLGAAFEDYLGYWLNDTGYFVAVGWDAAGAVCGLAGGGLPCWPPRAHFARATRAHAVRARHPHAHLNQEERRQPRGPRRQDAKITKKKEAQAEEGE
ncbi:MAG: hypothetical protein JXQ29_01610 [Planctomycetes bacterium]|nr:hypothetical protein [Planctomycetota bacterium]